MMLSTYARLRRSVPVLELTFLYGEVFIFGLILNDHDIQVTSVASGCDITTISLLA